MIARALALLAVLALGAGAAGAEPRGAARATVGVAPAAPPASPAALALAAPSSPLQGAARVALALVAVVAVMLASVAGYRWLLGALRPPARGTGSARRGWFSRWILPGHDGDRVDVLARSWVGAKESVCLIRAGNERFLVGVTTARVSLLGRLDAGALAAGAAASGPGSSAAAERLDDPGRPSGDEAPAFARELASAAARGAATAGPVAAPEPPGPPPVTEESIRAALARTRQRRIRTRRPARVEVHVA